MNLKKLQMLMLISVTPILACYCHSARAVETVIYKCHDQTGVVRFQDYTCTAGNDDEVIVYIHAEYVASGLRPTEREALQRLHQRQIEREADIRAKERDKVDTSLNIQIYDTNYFVRYK